MPYFMLIHPETVVAPEMKQFLPTIQSNHLCRVKRGGDPKDLKPYAGAIRYARAGQEGSKLINRCD